MSLVPPNKKILWIDTETGGTEPKTDALLQLAALIEVEGEIVDEINLKMQPFKNKVVSVDAIKTNGLSMEKIKTFEKPEKAYMHFYDFLSKHGKRKNKAERFVMAGYNSDFDCRFLSQWFEDISGGPYAYWDFLQFSPIDPLSTIRGMRYGGVIDIPNTMLETCCDYFGIKIDAHDALSDIRATRELTHIVFSRLWDGWSKTDF